MDRRPLPPYITPPHYIHRNSTPPLTLPVYITPPHYLHRKDTPQHNNTTYTYRPYFPIDLPPGYDTFHVPTRSSRTETARDPRSHRRSVCEPELRDSLTPPPPPIATPEERMTELQNSQIATNNSMQAALLALTKQVEQMEVRFYSSNRHRHQSKSPSPRQSETKSIESITPAPILQDSVNRFVSPSCTKQVVTEEKKPADFHLMTNTSPMQQPGNSNLPNLATNLLSNGHFPDFCSKFGVNPLVLPNSRQSEPVAAQVFEETPEPSVKAVGDENEGRRSQRPEAPQSNHSAKVLGNQKGQIQKSDESKVQECKIEIAVTDSTESSYFVEGNCELETDFLLAAHHVRPCSQKFRRRGEKMERIGVG